MTLADLISRLGAFSNIVIGVMIAIPLFTAIYTQWLGTAKGMLSPHKYVLSAIVYLSCIPGMFAASLTAYSLFFLESNLLQVNAVIYFLPFISMLATLVLLQKRANLDALPGFGRLQGLMLLLATTFIITFLLMRLRVWLFFGGSGIMLLAGMAIVFVLLRYGTRLLLRGRSR